MKIILCLSLIMLGISSMVRYRNQRKKEKRDIVNKVIANHIIAKEALTTLLVESLINQEEQFKAVEKSASNSLDIILQACGDAYIDEFFEKLGGLESKEQPTERI